MHRIFRKYLYTMQLRTDSDVGDTDLGNLEQEGSVSPRAGESCSAMTLLRDHRAG